MHRARMIKSSLLLHSKLWRGFIMELSSFFSGFNTVLLLVSWGLVVARFERTLTKKAGGL